MQPEIRYSVIYLRSRLYCDNTLKLATTVSLLPIYSYRRPIYPTQLTVTPATDTV